MRISHHRRNERIVNQMSQSTIPPKPSTTKLWRGRPRNGYENRIFLAFLGVVTVPLLLLGALAGGIYYRQNQVRNDALLNSACKNTEDQIELVLSHLLDYYTAVTAGNDYMSLLESKTPPNCEYRAVRDMQLKLGGGYHVDNYVSSYTCINVTDGWLLSNTGTYPLEQVSNYDELMKLLSQWDEENTTAQWVNRTDIAGRRRDNPPYTVPLYGELLVIQRNSLYGTSFLIIQLNLTPLYDMIAPWQESGYSIAVVDDTGKTILITSDDLATVIKQNISEPGLSVQNGWRINRGTQCAHGLTYYAAIPQSALFEPTSTVLLLALLVAGVIVIVLILCRRFSADLYQPVDRLVQVTKNLLGQPQSGEEEFDYLMAGVAHMAQDQQTMQMMMKRQKQQLEQTFIANLIRSEVTAEAIEHTVEELGLQPCPAYRLIAVALDTSPDTSDPARATMLLTALQEFPQTLYEQCFLCPTMINYTLVLVIGGSENELNEKCHEVFQAAVDIIHEVLGLSCRGGVSLPFHGLHHLSLAAQRAWEALRLPIAQLPDTCDDLIFYHTQDDQPDHGGYDILLEREIIAAVTECKASEANILLGRFVAKIKKQNIQGYERQFYIQRLIVAIFALAEDVGLSVNQIPINRDINREYNLFASVANIYAMDRLQQFLMEEVVNPIIESLTEFRQTNSSNLVENILELIRQTRGDITLTECADQLNYNPRYIWKVLRSELDTSFSDLVGDEKLKLAKELLLTTDMTVVQVADSLNYSNVQNFIRFFSKKVGMTPGKYKKDYSTMADSTGSIVADSAED